MTSLQSGQPSAISTPPSRYAAATALGGLDETIGETRQDRLGLLRGGEYGTADKLPDRHARPVRRLLDQPPFGGIDPGGD